MSKFEIAPLVRKDGRGKITFMCRSGGYVMCRRPRAMPFILSEKEWRKLEPFEAPFSLADAPIVKLKTKEKPKPWRD